MLTACGAPRVVNTGEAPPASVTTPPPASLPTPASNVHLVDASDYAARTASTPANAGYYFTTPSGKWRCAILTRTKAGCQAAGGLKSALGIGDAPDEVPGPGGAPVTPNAVVIGWDGQAQFVALSVPEFTLDTGTANVLPFNRVLAAAGFRCNVQESGVSCASELSGQGFTFSADGYTMAYTDVPADAP